MRRFWSHSGGATGTEYALIAVIVSITIVASLRIIGVDVAGFITRANSGFAP